MNERLNIKRLALIFLSLLAIAMLFITLAFNFQSIKVTVIGVSQTEGANGYDFLKDFTNIENGLAKWIGVFDIFMIIIASLEIMVYGYWLYIYMTTSNYNAMYYNGSSLEKTEKTIVWINLISTVIYMINGFAWVHMLENNELFSKLINQVVSEYGANTKIRTFAFIPVIITFVVMILYYFVHNTGEDSIPIYTHNNGHSYGDNSGSLSAYYNQKSIQRPNTNVYNSVATTSTNINKKPVSNAQTEDNKNKKTIGSFEVLTKAKELYDQNIITNEEFEKIKKQYLNEIIK